jgi:hypothetical protein
MPIEAWVLRVLRKTNNICLLQQFLWERCYRLLGTSLSERMAFPSLSQDSLARPEIRSQTGLPGRLWWVRIICCERHCKYAIGRAGLASECTSR